MTRQATGVEQGPSEQELHVGIERAKVVRRPALERRQGLRVDPQEERFPLAHRVGPALGTSLG
jgi:hypothetical protein